LYSFGIYKIFFRVGLEVITSNCRAGFDSLDYSIAAFLITKKIYPKTKFVGEIESKSLEYQKIELDYKLTVAYRVTNPKIISNDRNENYILWKSFLSLKSFMKLVEIKENEKFLYHGSDEYN
jgi:hypothetical protein